MVALRNRCSLRQWSGVDTLMARYLLPTPPPLRPPSASRLDVSGEDVLFRDRMEISAGDFVTVTGDAAAEQSVRREHAANVGSLMRRPDWGVGVSDTLFRNLTKSMTDVIVTRSRRRMLANPRVGRLISSDVVRLTNDQGVALIVKYEPVGIKRPQTVTIRGGR